MEPTLEYKYDQYEEDFHDEDGNDKNKPALNVSYQLQTDVNDKVKEPSGEE